MGGGGHGHVDSARRSSWGLSAPAMRERAGILMEFGDLRTHSGAWGQLTADDSIDFWLFEILPSAQTEKVFPFLEEKNRGKKDKEEK